MQLTTGPATQGHAGAPLLNGMSQASANGSADCRDVYGFPVADDEATRAARARCSDAAEAVRPKWTKLRQQMANNQAREDKVKKYCRKVRAQALLPAALLPHSTRATLICSAWAAYTRSGRGPIARPESSLAAGMISALRSYLKVFRQCPDCALNYWPISQRAGSKVSRQFAVGS